MTALLTLNAISAETQDSALPLLKGLSLTVQPGETHVIMGPNGAGKSSLVKLLAGHPDIKVTEGEMRFKAQDGLTLSASERAQMGLFIGFQYPIEIPGLSNIQFLKASSQAIKKAQGLQPLTAIAFLSHVRSHLAQLDIDESFLHRDMNHGLSGGEKKRNEMLQLLLLDPVLAVLDEPDSGLDVNALKTLTQTLQQWQHVEKGLIVVTHYPRLLDQIKPDYLHILIQGRIRQTCSGEQALALAQSIEENGYGT